MQLNDSDFLDRQISAEGRGAVPPRPYVELEILRGRAQCRRRPMTVPAFLIGSARDCDLVLAAPRFPDVHAYFRLTESGVVVRHLGFAPLLCINGRAVSSAQLRHGDRITAGPFEFALHIHASFSGRPTARPDRIDPGGPALRFDAAVQPPRPGEVEPASRVSALRLYVEREGNASSTRRLACERPGRAWPR